MKYVSISPEAYIEQLPIDRQEVIVRLRKIIRENLPTGFEEMIAYDMISYVVPKSIYPPGYHCTPEQPLPFLSIASQKNHVALYHMGIYMDTELLKWFEEAYSKLPINKLDMGKSCIRFKKMAEIPYDLIAELCQKMTVEAFVLMYQRALNR